MTNQTQLHAAKPTFIGLGALVTMGFGLYAFLRHLGIRDAASVSAYSIVFLTFVLEVVRSVRASSNAAKSLAGSVVQGADIDWGKVKRASEDAAAYSVGEIAPIAFLTAYVAFAAHHAVNGNLQPIWFGICAAIALWIFVFAAFVFIPRFLVWAFKGSVPSWLQVLEFPLRVVLPVVGAFYAAELIAGTTTRTALAYFATGLAAMAACVALLYGSMFAGFVAGRLTASFTARFCKATRRILRLQPTAAYVVHWLETLIRGQIAVQVGAAVLISVLAYSVARIVNPTVVFAVLAFLGLLMPLLSVMRLARTCDRTAYYQVPKTFFIFAATYTVVVSAATALAYAATRGVARVLALVEEWFGAAVFPDFLYFFASTSLNDLPIWAQVEGASLGALVAVVASWVAAVVQRRDWMELSTGAVVLVGATAIPAATGLFEAGAISYLQQRLPLTPRAAISLAISAVVMAGYRLLTTRLRKEKACTQCGESDIPPFARFCPTCGCPLEKTADKRAE